MKNITRQIILIICLWGIYLNTTIDPGAQQIAMSLILCALVICDALEQPDSESEPMPPTRHTILTRAGWRYDATQDRYTAPGAPQNGTAPLYNLEAAWDAHMRAQAIKTDPRQRRPL